MLATITSAWADPAARVTAAVQALRDASNYTWETMAGSYGAARSGRPELRLSEDHRTEHGQCDRDGQIVITRLARDRRPEQTGVHLPGRAAMAETDTGFQTVDDLRAALRLSDASRSITFKGVALRRRDLLLSATGLCQAVPAERELTRVVNDIEEFWEEGEHILGRMSAAGVRRTSPGRVNPQATVIVVFHIRDGHLQSYLVASPRPSAPSVARVSPRPPPITGMAVRFSEIGTTTVIVPAEVWDKLR